MSLQQKLSEFATQMAAQAPKEVLEAMGGFIGSLHENEIAENAKGKGDNAPDFSLQDVEGNFVSLQELTKDKPLILSFNRGNWCPFCNIEFSVWQQEQANLDKANFAMIMPQLKEKSAQLKPEKGLTYRILEDKGNKVADRFGLKFQLTAPLREIHKAFGMDIPGHNGDDTYTLPLASTYIIDQNQQITYAYINPNWMERAEPSVVLSNL